MSDERRAALLAAAREGDASAFEGLYRIHHRNVHALALRLSRDEPDARELTQETFVRAWRGLPSFRGDSGLGTWLHAIAVRANAELQRHRGRSESRRAEEVDVEAHAFLICKATGHRDLDLERAIASLPPGAREVLVLHDIQGYRHREIGEMLGIADGTARAQLHRARQLVRAHLERGTT